MDSPASNDRETAPELVARVRAHLAAATALLERLRDKRLAEVGQLAGDRAALMVAVTAWADVCKAGDLVYEAEELVK